MLRLKEKISHGENRPPEAEAGLEGHFPLSPLSLNRGKHIDSFFRIVSGRKIWAGAFRDRSSAFRNIRLETVVEASLPYFLCTLRGGHLFSSRAPFAFPLDLIARHGPPGDLTILSTGSILASLRVSWSDRAGVRELLRRDSELSEALLSSMERPDMIISRSVFQMQP